MKKRKKAIKIIIITLCVLLFLIIGVLTTGYIAINKMFSMVSESFETTRTTEQQEQIITPENGPALVESPTPASEQIPKPTKQPAMDSVNPPPQATSKPKQPEPTKKPEVQMKLPLHNVSLSDALFKTLTAEIPFSDKLAVFNILTNGLPKEDMKRIVSMVQGGITNEEVREAYGILSHGLSDENKGKILEYYYKHVGLIQ